MQFNTTERKSIIFYKFPLVKEYSHVYFDGNKVFIKYLRGIINQKELLTQVSNPKSSEHNYLTLYNPYTMKEYKDSDIIEADSKVLVKRCRQSSLYNIPVNVHTMYTKLGIEQIIYEDILSQLTNPKFLIIRPGNFALFDRIILTKRYCLNPNALPTDHNGEIYLVFSIHNSGKFQGYAKVEKIASKNPFSVELELRFFRLTCVNFHALSFKVKNLKIPNNTAEISYFPQFLDLFEETSHWYLPQTIIPPQKSCDIGFKSIVPEENNSTLEEIDNTCNMLDKVYDYIDNLKVEENTEKSTQESEHEDIKQVRTPRKKISPLQSKFKAEIRERSRSIDRSKRSCC